VKGTRTRSFANELPFAIYLMESSFKLKSPAGHWEGAGVARIAVRSGKKSLARSVCCELPLLLSGEPTLADG